MCCLNFGDGAVSYLLLLVRTCNGTLLTYCGADCVD